ncbi:hypothetical protein SAMN06297382_0955 [Amphiplicatus metriothermophilus]|uniref:Uncharacterized protein n=1 Tax=Amphiplicatus metriothermophilus TaxID=1519374 RepID=A0A239PNP7_9PROT|nr:hypothetical protein [Amphiplicatus metriothermophilus]SNT71934.1 hypothetical protein SAMN06297382_0955 [Amphiplicatus metriothermophilus]
MSILDFVNYRHAINVCDKHIVLEIDMSGVHS